MLKAREEADSIQGRQLAYAFDAQTGKSIDSFGQICQVSHLVWRQTNIESASNRHT